MLEIYSHLSEMKEEKSIEALDNHLDEMIKTKRYSKTSEIAEEAPVSGTADVLPA